VLRTIFRALSIGFWIFVYGVLVFFTVGISLFLSRPPESRLAVALIATAIVMIAAFVGYGFRVKFRFGQDWAGLSPQMIGKRVYWVLFNGTGQADHDAK
jgi:hypothetical protein